MSSNMLSLYIPRVGFNDNIQDYITYKFHTLNLGKVSHIDLISKMDARNKIFTSAYVHFEEWYDTPASIIFREKICAPGSTGTRIIYDDPSYWIVLINSSKKNNPYERNAKPMFDLSELRELREI